MRPAIKRAVGRSAKVNAVVSRRDREDFAAACRRWSGRAAQSRDHRVQIAADSNRSVRAHSGFVKRGRFSRHAIDAIQNAIVARPDENIVAARCNRANVFLRNGSEKTRLKRACERTIFGVACNEFSLKNYVLRFIYSVEFAFVSAGCNQ